MKRVREREREREFQLQENNKKKVFNLSGDANEQALPSLSLVSRESFHCVLPLAGCYTIQDSKCGFDLNILLYRREPNGLLDLHQTIFNCF